LTYRVGISPFVWFHRFSNPIKSCLWNFFGGGGGEGISLMVPTSCKKSFLYFVAVTFCFSGFSDALNWLYVDSRIRELGSFGTRSIRPKFPEIPVQNRMEQKDSGYSFKIFWSNILEIPETSCSFRHFYLVRIGPSSSSREKPQDCVESTLPWMQNDLPQFEPFIDCLSSTKTLGSAFLENCGLVVPNFLWAFVRFA